VIAEQTRSSKPTGAMAFYCLYYFLFGVWNLFVG